MSERSETTVLVVTHGDYGHPLVATAEALVGPLDVNVLQVCPGTGREALQRRIEQYVREREPAGETLLLVDLCGSTPANICLSLVTQNETCEMVSGLNLAMLVKLSTCDRRIGARGLARELLGSSRRSTVLGSSLQPNGGPCGH
jgi:mannose/fructose-specific phosphotransferase system component IIA